jgi:fatty-acyl-CoA synthase
MDAGHLMWKRADLTPERIALVELETGARYTYKALNERTNRLANFLRDKLEVEKGDRVSIIGKNSVVYLDLLYGLPKIGAIFSPFNWRLTAAELIYMVKDLGPKVLICEPDFHPILKEILEEAHIEHIVSLRGLEMKEAWVYEEEVEAASSDEPWQPEMDGETTYAILYTSGTTGHPKGAVIPHRQVLFNCVNTAASWGLREDDVSPVYTPLFHAGGLFAFLTPILYLGGKIILARDFNPEESLGWILEEGCTVILGVPTLFQMWMESDYFESADFGSVRYFISGGAACPPQMIRAWRESKGIVFRQGFGMTEVGVNCFSMTDEESVLKTGSVGKPIFHSKMRIVDPDTGEDVPVGKSGELLISGPHVFSGYWRNPAATNEAIVDGWFHTGDMVHMDEDGFYYVDGRYKDMIKSGGENIYAAEVEEVYRSHQAVKDAALIGMPDKKWGEVGLIILVIEGDKQVSEDELREFCQDKLARFKIPKNVIFADSLPYSAYGKIEKEKLKAKYLA